MDAEGGVGEHDVLLCGQGTVFQHGIENLGGLLFRGTADEFLGFGKVEAKVLRFEDTLIVVGGDLEIAGERDFVVAVDGGHDAIVNADALIDIAIESHLVEIGHAEQLAGRLAGIDQRAQEVENGGELQCLADGTDKLHRTGEELSVQVDDARLLKTTVQAVEVVGEADAVMLDDIAGAAHRCSGIVAVLRHLVASTGNDETSRGGDVERVLTIAARADHVDVAVGIQNGGHAGFQDAVAEAQQLVDRHPTHLQGSEQGGDLFGGELILRDAHEDVLHLLTCEYFVVQEFL